MTYYIKTLKTNVLTETTYKNYTRIMHYGEEIFSYDDETIETHTYSYDFRFDKSLGSVWEVSGDYDGGILNCDEYRAGYYDEYDMKLFKVEWKTAQWDYSIEIPSIVKHGSSTYEECLNEVLKKCYRYEEEGKAYYDHLKILYEIGVENRRRELEEEEKREKEKQKLIKEQKSLQEEYESNIDLYNRIVSINENYANKKRIALLGFLIIAVIIKIIDFLLKGAIGGNMWFYSILATVFLYTIPYIVIRIVLAIIHSHNIYDVKQEYYIKNNTELTDKKIDNVFNRKYII